MSNQESQATYRTELKLDIDKSRLPEKELVERLVSLDRFLHFKDLSIDKRKTKNGWHLRINFNSFRELDDRDIVFMQLLLLSDFRRELFNLLRVWNHSKVWNILFNGKTKTNGRLISKEVKM